jgi:hypothetical protein
MSSPSAANSASPANWARSAGPAADTADQQIFSRADRAAGHETGQDGREEDDEGQVHGGHLRDVPPAVAAVGHLRAHRDGRVGGHDQGHHLGVVQ